ncbi:ATP synthase subunit b', chloroplastic-like [Primulina eburnea]|uniref:ATP synthase subunit b', chloroplastic-like n=1 Tax=Primulina eburnea TaxID=1245227 RepID=UPI003C6C3296
MANMIMASSKAFVNSISPIPTPKLTPLPKIPLPASPKPLQLPSSLKSVPSLLAAAASFTLANVPPSLAEELEKSQLFDFNLTLPIIAAEFLILMFALDKVYYSPLGKFMDERDAAIREKLSSVKDTSAEVKALEEKAAAVMRAARAEISAALNKMKKETQLEVEQKLAEGRKKVELELQEALASLEKQKEDTIKALDSQITALSDEIVKKVLPVS